VRKEALSAGAERLIVRAGRSERVALDRATAVAHRGIAQHGAALAPSMTPPAPPRAGVHVGDRIAAGQHDGARGRPRHEQ
jgi:hypothetical protein